MRHLDTCIIIACLNGNETIAERLNSHLLSGVAISSVVLGELLYGAWASARSAENLDSLRTFVQLIDVCEYDRKCADAYSRIRLSLRRKGRPSGEADMMIAAIALADNATLVTDNTKHFEMLKA